MKGKVIQKQGAASADGSVVTSQAHPGLPYAPSDIGVASHKAAVRAQLVAEFDQVVDKMKGAPRRIAGMLCRRGELGEAGAVFKFKIKRHSY